MKCSTTPCTGCPHCNPVFAALIAASPRQQAQFSAARTASELCTFTARRGQPAVLLTTAPTVVAAEPPSLVAAVNARRAATARKGIPLGPVPEPVIFGGGPRPRPTVAATNEPVPDPPSLTDAINARRSR